MARDWTSAPLSDPDRALCAFASKLTHHAKDVSAADIDALRDQGFADRAIHDAVQVIGYFNYVTRVADGLGIEAEDFIRPWGQPEKETSSD